MKPHKFQLICIVLLIFASPTVCMSEASYRFSESSINSDPGDWLGLDENQVFYKKLTHQEAGNSWEIKIGKGGQIFSIQTPELGEIIGHQRAKFGQWVDEVYQHVIPMPPQRTSAHNVVDGDIHQAGYYTLGDLDRKRQLLPKSVYSPLFSYQFSPATNSVSYVTWPQHAHLPRTYSENLVLIHQTIKDLGGGVAEISVEFYKWGGAPYEGFNLPWTSIRTSTLPAQILSTPDGGYFEETHAAFRNAPTVKLNENTTGGWIAFTSSNAPSARGIGIVYGKKISQLETRNSYLRWGIHGSQELAFTPATVKRSVELHEGETLYYRYYLVFGTLANIQTKANELESKVILKKITISPENSARLAVCKDNINALKPTCANKEKPIFLAFKDFIPSSKPLFLLQNAATGRHMVTDDPYEISFDPTDGSTKYTDLLGWAVPKSMAADSCRYQPLNEAVSSMKQNLQMGKNTADLYVMRTTEARCGNSPSVK